MINIPKQLQREEFRFLLLRPKAKEPVAAMAKWQEANFQFDNPFLIDHLEKGGNYGIIGGYGNLILIDSDSEEITKIADTLPETFTIKTGSPEHYKKHYFYIANKKVKPIRLSNEKVGDLGDVRSVGQYVVAPNSIHPSGNNYKVINDLPIANITEYELRSKFKDYIDKKATTEFKKFPIVTSLRNSRFVRECNVPDYVLNNKLKSNTSKNWQLFPYIIDILFNRQVLPEVYKQLANSQDHNLSAIKGWVNYAREGKLAKISCKKMREYLERFHPELISIVCKDCKLCKRIIKKKEIETSYQYSKLQKNVLLALNDNERDKATEMIVKEIEKTNYIYTTRDDIKSEMWIYKDGVYIPQGKSFIKEFCRGVLDLAFTTNLSNAIIAKVEADTFIEHDEFFKTNYLYEIPLTNGIINLKTKELSEHTPKKIFFNKLPIEYDPSAECPNIINHFKSVLKREEDILVMLELFGYLLYKEYKVEKAFMFVGFGRNGKSKTIELMKRFLGAENCSSLPLRSLYEESFSLSELFGKMANLAADLSKTDLKDTGMIKALIGRDYIQAKRKYLRDLNFVNYAKMVFAANELPKIYDTTDGFWTKWVLLEFPYKFINEKIYNKLSKEDKKNHKILDPDIIEKLTTPEELSGLFNLALDNLDNLIKQKDFSYSRATKEVKDIWIRKSDSFTAFCYDHVEEEIDNRVAKKQLKKYYFQYRKLHKIAGCSEKAIKITLDNMFGVDEFQEWEGNRERYWEGIKLINLDVLNGKKQ